MSLRVLEADNFKLKHLCLQEWKCDSD